MPCMSANGHKPFAALLGFCLQLLLSGVPQGDDARLRGWLAVPHPVMPQMPLSVRETEAVIAYIRSFAD